MEPRLYFQALVNMAGCYTCLNKTSQSISYFKKAVSIANKFLLEDIIDVDQV
jgi:hypothetical protein